MSYANRRYQVVEGRLRRRYDRRDDPDWFLTKPEALEAEEVKQKRRAAAAIKRAEWTPLPPSETETVNEPAGDDYENWSGPQLRSEIKARTGKGPKPGVELTKAAMIARLRALDLTGWPVAEEVTGG